MLQVLEGRDLPSTYYVASTGSDTAAGSAAAPWKTLQKAANTLAAGDTVHVTVVNPGDDPHTFTIAALNFSIAVKGQSRVEGSFVVPSAGLYKFFCSIPEHSPYMWGNLVVLPDSAAPGA